MSRNVIIVVVIVLALGGRWYLSISSVPTASEITRLSNVPVSPSVATKEAKSKPTTQTPTPTLPQTREDVKVGDQVGSLVVTDIKVIALQSGDPEKDLRISFSGETLITGTYAVGGFSGPDEISITVSKAENPQLPYFLLDATARWVDIVLNNSVTARQALVTNSGKATIKIRNLSAAWATGTEAVTTAEFVALVR